MTQYDKYHINRCDALEFLLDNFGEFPEQMPSLVIEVAAGISEDVFRGWRFVQLEGGELVFAGCLSPCIRARDFENVRRGVYDC